MRIKSTLITMTTEKPYSLTIRIDALPKSINQTGRLHWAAKNKIVQQWKALVRFAVGHQVPKEPLEKAELIYTRYSSRCLDFDNLVNSYKAVQDGLVGAGVIQDDKVKNIGYPTYRWVKTKQKQGYITIEIKELSPDHSRLEQQ